MVPAKGCAVKGITAHTRYEPQLRCFSYDVYMFRFDLRAPPVGYVREDHYGDPLESLDATVRKTVKDRLGFWPSGKIEAVCNLRLNP